MSATAAAVALSIMALQASSVIARANEGTPAKQLSLDRHLMVLALPLTVKPTAYPFDREVRGTALISSTGTDRLLVCQPRATPELGARIVALAERESLWDRRQQALTPLRSAARIAGIATRSAVTLAPIGADDLLFDNLEGEHAFEQLEAAENSLDIAFDEQIASLEEIAFEVKDRSASIVTLLDRIGREASSTNSSMGGPWVTVSSADTFVQSVERIRAMIYQYSALRETTKDLPIVAPVSNARMSSEFGLRNDPFRRRPAMHSGIDFRIPSGEPVQATASGIVKTAGHAGGYGNLIEIDHGHALATRFAHLSKIAVKVGQSVDRADVIGHTGNSGRSTGPHLHYEIRIDDHSVDPMMFMRVGGENSGGAIDISFDSQSPQYTNNCYSLCSHAWTLRICHPPRVGEALAVDD